MHWSCLSNAKLQIERTTTITTFCNCPPPSYLFEVVGNVQSHYHHLNTSCNPLPPDFVGQSVLAHFETTIWKAFDSCTIQQLLWAENQVRFFIRYSYFIYYSHEMRGLDIALVRSWDQYRGIDPLSCTKDVYAPPFREVCDASCTICSVSTSFATNPCRIGTG